MKNDGYDDHRHDGRQKPRQADLEDANAHQIRERIDATRHRLDDTVDALVDRLRPRQLMEEIFDTFDGDNERLSRIGRSFGRIGRRFVDQIEHQPVPAALIGAGLVWLMIGGRRESTTNDVGGREHFGYEHEYEHDYEQGTRLDTPYFDVPHFDPGLDEAGPYARLDYEGPDYEGADYDQAPFAASGGSTGYTGHASHGPTGSASDAEPASASHSGKAPSETLKHKASQAWHSAREASAKTARRTRSAIRSARHGIEGGAKRVGVRVGETYERTRETVSRSYESSPLAVGAGVAALGVVCGLLLPKTRREDEWLGETADQWKSDAAEVAGSVASRTTKVASAAAGAAVRAAGAESREQFDEGRQQAGAKDVDRQKA